MTIDARIKAFVILGLFLRQFGKSTFPVGSSSGSSTPLNEKTPNGNPEMKRLNETFAADLEQLINTVHIHNPWFTEANVRNAMAAISDSLEENALVEWIAAYIKDLDRIKEPKRVAVIMAGNIPMVGFHDMLCVLLSGNKFVGKLSSDDKLLLPFIAKILCGIEPEYAVFIEFTEDQLKNMDAVIATGSNNSARYFDYYFGKYPNIIRRNRNSAAVLTGSESNEELRLLGDDVFRYFGLGCRNVSKLFVPKGYHFDAFYEAIYEMNDIVNNNKYANNYDYNKTVYLMSSDPSLLDNNFLLLKEDVSFSSPIGVLFYEYYDDLQTLNERLEKEKEKIQCIVSASPEIKNAIPFGTAQYPKLNDYADGIDTMKFLTGL